VLAAFARADAAGPIAPLRFSLIHAYLEPGADAMALAARLGVIVAAQPSIQYRNGGALLDQLGARAENATPLRSWIRAGVRVAGGSDGPDFHLDPRLGLWQASTRAVENAHGAVGPGEALDGAEALALYTTGAAHLAFAERKRGVLRAGMAADLTALSLDPTTAEPQALRTLSVHATMVGGRVVHDAVPA
jgi:predicted amidohydrolase YtcJ